MDCNFNCGQIEGLVGLAFSASMGILMIVLACAIPGFGQVWWPMFVLVFYILCPIPMLISKRLASSDSIGATSSALQELCVFLTSGIVMSAYGLPMVLMHVGTLTYQALLLVLFGNTWSFITILIFFRIFRQDDDFEFQSLI
ncbi:leptin receptor gene-related protein isoform X3 [Strongylocentrotus purpuratus]|uniref:Leptin receptor overlapping transcript-like 1 n=1 Tax=Strongylocentrotus purpuratus TaxID=7668 RepID=A0A7M7PK32_STRPU|nr:leptin receptor gene-related protein-like isoform X1 [Strongylocentrotus purpuratus]XP_030851932.1 leptin receptor gene-related protein isoform X3 [Strongylocentrotus purpuratus]|eukprot:XP_011679215.1 PREDICTED: leptin receptor gene-related protein isoform X2 [Strongylocentrotus purpuratus]